MTISVPVFVGAASDMLLALIAKAKALKVGCVRFDGVDSGHDFVIFLYARWW
jgi:hypothetical protein